MTQSAENDAGLTVTAVFRQEPSEGVRGCVGLEVLGGPKAFLRIWDGGERDWGWRVHESATQVWPRVILPG